MERKRQRWGKGREMGREKTGDGAFKNIERLC